MGFFTMAQPTERWAQQAVPSQIMRRDRTLLEASVS